MRTRSSAIIIFFPLCFWVKTEDRGREGRSHFYPEIGLACPPSSPNCRAAEKLRAVAWRGDGSFLPGIQWREDEDSSYILASFRPDDSDDQSGVQAGSITQQRLSSELCRFSSLSPMNGHVEPEKRREKRGGDERAMKRPFGVFEMRKSRNRGGAPILFQQLQTAN